MKKSNLEIIAISRAFEARYNGVLRFVLETDWDAIDNHKAERAIFGVNVFASSVLNPERARNIGEALVDAASVVDALNAREWRIRYNLKVDRDELAVYEKMLTERVSAGVPVADVVAFIEEM